MAGFTRFHFACCTLHRAFRRVYSFRFLFHRKPVRQPSAARFHPSLLFFFDLGRFQSESPHLKLGMPHSKFEMPVLNDLWAVIVRSVDATDASLIYRWDSLPDVLTGNNLNFWFSGYDATNTSAVDYGMIDFEVLSDGPVWMLVTTRFGSGGNSSGDWLPEVTTQAQLEDDGWSQVASGITTTMNKGTSDLTYILYERTCTAGETFRIRTEKYHCPIPLVVSTPEPATISMIVLGGLAMLRRKR